MPDRPRLVIASGNAGKLREYRDLLSDAGVDIVAFDSEVDEVGDTYAANARLKAETALAKSGLPALGDDSGIELDALDGFPGIGSARLGPTQRDRTAELLSRLNGVPRPWLAR
ncbi:MAG: non-canonical purine NTP pyrophosphatase, partial [Chloroflexi bacterium]